MTAPSFLETMVLVFGGCGVVMWVLFDVLEEQLIGGSRSEVRRAAAARAHAAKRKAAPAVRSRAVPLPRARVHRP